jgi:hypothetical protein
MKMRSNTADIKRSIKIREETKAATREATVESKKVMEMIRELKDKAPSVRTHGHMSCLAVVANGMLALGALGIDRVKAVSI